MDAYTELVKSKSREDKFHLVIKGERQYLYSGWEINQITSRLNNSYYKRELLNTVMSMLSSGTKPENIYILNDTIKLNNSYEKIKSGFLDLKKSKDLLELFYLGSPIPLIPKKHTYKMFYIFEICRIINSKIEGSKIIPVSKEKLLYSLVRKMDTFKKSDDIKKEIRNSLIKNNQDVLKKDPKVLIKIDKKVDSPVFFYKRWDELIADDGIDDLIENDSVDNYLDNNNRISRFFNTFKNHEKPILCEYNEKTQTIQILCIDMIVRSYFKEENPRLLETKQISQNSPLMISIGIGLGFLPSIVKLCEVFYHANSTKKEKIKEVEEINKKIKLDEEEIHEQEAVIKALDKVKETFEVDEKVSRRTFIAKNQMEMLYEEEDEGLKKIFEGKKLSIDYIEMQSDEKRGEIIKTVS